LKRNLQGHPDQNFIRQDWEGVDCQVYFNDPEETGSDAGKETCSRLSTKGSERVVTERMTRMIPKISSSPAQVSCPLPLATAMLQETQTASRKKKIRYQENYQKACG
jgi:hypothetical protein